MASGGDSSDLKAAFLAYCRVISHDSVKGNASTIRKMCTDTGINKTKMKQNDIDLEYARCFGTSKEGIDYASFVRFVENFLGPAYGRMNGMEEEQAVQEIKDKFSKAHPQLRNTTKVSNDAVTKRLVDPKNFPTASKEKFDPSYKQTNSQTDSGRPIFNRKP
ncbi:p25-alpha domain containing protein [Fasciola gigantica]|uniref:p25-alpha domain containing protein n=1 Tax=Fasciola gigantica TaxID=46835 RepID=A0A504YNN2_FASGI|nr:p25-alpha domain containing protein [Fasciola gigantica]